MTTLKIYANNASEIYEFVIEADTLKDALKKLKTDANAESNPLIEDDACPLIYGTPMDTVDINNLLNEEDDYE